MQKETLKMITTNNTVPLEINYIYNDFFKIKFYDRKNKESYALI